MRKVITLACLLALASHIAAQQCNSLPTYSETFTPQCAQGDLYVNWPNYENAATYYKCQGVGNPVIQYCPASQYFAFVLQQCVSCGQYIPAVPCSQLKTQNPPNCVPINNGGTTGGTTGVTTSGTTGGTTLPSPIYPSSTTTPRTTTERSTRSTRTTAPTEATTPTATPPTPPTQTTPSDGILGPPSPVTNDPNVPLPPTPRPTPPIVVVTPPPVVEPVAP